MKEIKLRILVVDDMAMMRKLVLQYLQRNEAVLLVGEASDGEEAIAKAKECKPDVVLLDISLPGTSGIEAARKIKSVLPKSRVYLYSAYELNEFREMDPHSPADGFIRKSHLKVELMEMIRKELERKKISRE